MESIEDIEQLMHKKYSINDVDSHLYKFNYDSWKLRSALHVLVRNSGQYLDAEERESFACKTRVLINNGVALDPHSDKVNIGFSKSIEEYIEDRLHLEKVAGLESQRSQLSINNLVAMKKIIKDKRKADEIASRGNCTVQ